MIAYGKAPVHYPSEQPTECFFVEGDSAAKSVDRVRDPRSQAILALQGKPLNAMKASRSAIFANAVARRIAFSLLQETETPNANFAEMFERLSDPSHCAYENIILLMDPDADGIHCGVLVMGFFRRLAPQLITDGRILVIQPPMYVFYRESVESADLDQSAPIAIAHTPSHAKQVEAALHEASIRDVRKTKHRGLGSLDARLLTQCCIAPNTRHQSCISMDDVKAALAAFGSPC